MYLKIVVAVPLQRETTEHFFLKRELPSSIWQYFSNAAGFSPMNLLKQNIRKWWNIRGNTRIKETFQVVPIIILWFLWKKGNTVFHGGSFSTGKVIWEITDTIRKYLNCRFKAICDSRSWVEIESKLEGYRPTNLFKIVRWIPPPINWLKCNTDGASRG